MNKLTRGRALVGSLHQSGQGGYGSKTVRLPIATTPNGTEQDTGFDLPAKAIVRDVFVDVRTAEATGGTKTMDVGLKAAESGGDTDGFLVGVDCSATGIKKGTLVSTGQTRGALLRADESGSSAFLPEPHVVGAAKSVVYSAGSADWAEFRGDIYVLYDELS
jgi:hypothetical protein